MRRFTRTELARFDGGPGIPSYIAYQGKVYDVSGSFLWQGGKHFVAHAAGTDLTGCLDDAPHGDDLLGRCPVIGELTNT